MTWGTGKPYITPSDVWTVDLTTNTWTAATGTTYEAESGTLSGGAKLSENSGFSGGKCVGYLGM